MFEIILPTKPHNVHYLKRYILFIRSCQGQNEGEKHHICPKSLDLFPEYKSFIKHPWNKVLLTLRQHFVAHFMLAKAFGGKQELAFKLMCNRAGRTTSRYYSHIRQKHIDQMTNNNHNADGKHTKAGWKVASFERREQQAEIMREVNKTKKKPKELRQYICVVCNRLFDRLEFSHKIKQQNFVCGHSCNGRRNGRAGLGKKNPELSKSLKGRTGWNKGIKGTGFGNPLTNPMKDPELVAKMLASRKRNKELRAEALNKGVSGYKELPNLD